MPLPPVLSAAEIQIFRQNVVELKHPVPIITYLMLEAGLRIAEALRLRWESLVHADQPMHALVLPAGICKFKHGRTLPISARLADMIYISWDHGHKFLGLLPPMFVSQPANHRPPITARTMQRQILEVGITNLGRRITPHLLRHTFATRLARVTDLRHVQEALGHQRITTTQIYAHTDPDLLRTAIDEMYLEPAKGA